MFRILCFSTETPINRHFFGVAVVALGAGPHIELKRTPLFLLLLLIDWVVLNPLLDASEM
jgi:hypothetical protein